MLCVYLKRMFILQLFSIVFYACQVKLVNNGAQNFYIFTELFCLLFLLVTQRGVLTLSVVIVDVFFFYWLYQLLLYRLRL